MSCCILLRKFGPSRSFRHLLSSTWRTLARCRCLDLLLVIDGLAGLYLLRAANEVDVAETATKGRGS